MSTPQPEKSRPAKPVKPRPAKPVKKRCAKRFSQSLFVIDGLFDGEDLLLESGDRLPATLAPKSIVAPGDRGEFVCYLKSLKSDEGYSNVLQLVRLRRPNDPHVRSLKDSGFVAGQVAATSPAGCLVRVTPRRAHNTPPFEVWVNWSTAIAPRRPLRSGTLICLRVNLSKSGEVWYQSYYQPPVKWWAGRKITPQKPVTVQ